MERWEGKLEGLQEARLAFYRLSEEQRLTETQHTAFESRLIHHELKCCEVLNTKRLELAQAYERSYNAARNLYPKEEVRP